MSGERCDLRWDRARHARCPERCTEDTWPWLGVLIGTIQRHECRNDLRFVFREFPILGSESTLAARAVLASRAQGLYEPFHRALLGADGPFDLDRILAVKMTESTGIERSAATGVARSDANQSRTSRRSMSATCRPWKRGRIWFFR